MALDQSALLEMMRSADEYELIRRLLGTIMQALMDAEATAFIGAEPNERSESRTTQRNGVGSRHCATSTRSSTTTP